VVLNGKIALVTGASRGIGRSTAVALAEAGADVAINYHSHHADAESVADAVQAAGRRALLLPGDVGDRRAVDEMVAKTVGQFGRLDIAVTNAVYSDRDIFHQADLDGFQRTIQVTMWGAFYTLRAAARQMIEQGHGGSIVVISSPHAFIPVPRSMAYNISKAAVEHMSRTAAIELSDYRIRINTLQPGWTDTPGERKFASEETLEAAGKQLPFGRLGTAEEMAEAILFMCNPQNNYMTGASLLIDGGITLPWWAKRGSTAPEQTH